MIEKLKADNIFTEYDDSIYLEINKDPLGLQMIWTYFGQQIFDNKTTSVAMDIRSYNINLFNHYLIYQLRKQDKFDNLFTKSFTTKEKVERMLILLENMLIWTWHKNPDGWVQKGLLGTSKAKEKQGNINLNLDDDIGKLELLKNQKSLGVNGRYKTPFVKMGFFDSNYNYIKNGIVTSEIDSDIFESDEIKEIFKKNEFKELYDSMMDFFDNTPLQKENISIEKNIKNLFANTHISADITKTFWLDKIGLKTDEAKLVYEAIESSNSTKDIYYKAYENSNNSSKLSNIIQLEPYLVYVTNLFDYLFKYDKKDITNIFMDEYFQKYQEYQKLSIANITSPSVKERLSKINEIDSISSLINYHKEIMKQRNQTQWIDIKDDNIKVYNPIKIPNDLEDELQKEIKDLDWIHDYYIYSIRNIKRGLGDLKDENENTN